MDSMLIVLGVVSILVPVVTFVGGYLFREKNEEKKQLLQPQLKVLSDAQSPNVTEKSQKVLAICSISFHYADKEQIPSLYYNLFKEPLAENIAIERAGELSTNAKGSINVVEGQVNNKDSTKVTTNFKNPSMPLSLMFLKYQNEMVTRNEVILDLDDVGDRSSELEAFNVLVERLRRDFEFYIPNDQYESKKIQLNVKASEATLLKLEQASGFVFMDGKFKVYLEGDLYKCVYSHPINEFLDTGDAVSITVVVSKSLLEQSQAVTFEQAVGRSMPLKVYGRIASPIDRSNGHKNLQITPIAIY